MLCLYQWKVELWEVKFHLKLEVNFGWIGSHFRLNWKSISVECYCQCCKFDNWKQVLSAPANANADFEPRKTSFSYLMDRGMRSIQIFIRRRNLIRVSVGVFGSRVSRTFSDVIAQMLSECRANVINYAFNGFVNLIHTFSRTLSATNPKKKTLQQVRFRHSYLARSLLERFFTSLFHELLLLLVLLLFDWTSKFH